MSEPEKMGLDRGEFFDCVHFCVAFQMSFLPTIPILHWKKHHRKLLCLPNTFTAEKQQRRTIISLLFYGIYRIYSAEKQQRIISFLWRIGGGSDAHEIGDQIHF